jgi:ArsR family transcriptional regulator
MSIPSPKNELLTYFADVAKALGHAHRLDLLEHIAQGERSVEALAKLAGLSVANASQHLQQLLRAGLVAKRRDGKHILYRLADLAVIELLSALRRIVERNSAEAQLVVQSYFHARDNLDPVSRHALLDRLRTDAVVLLDVRPEHEFALGHLPHAVNIPLPELEGRLAELPPDQEVVAYCRGPYCVLAFEAVAALRKHGFTVHRLQDGYPEWKAAGLPVESSVAEKA